MNIERVVERDFTLIPWTSRTHPHPVFPGTGDWYYFDSSWIIFKKLVDFVDTSALVTCTGPYDTSHVGRAVRMTSVLLGTKLTVTTLFLRGTGLR